MIEGLEAGRLNVGPNGAWPGFVGAFQFCFILWLRYAVVQQLKRLTTESIVELLKLPKPAGEEMYITRALKSLATKTKMFNQMVCDQYLVNPGIEIVYRELLIRDLARIGVPDDFYPVGSAANHGLLYLIARIMDAFPIRSVLEFGAGQSTFLVDALNRRRPQPFAARTIEHDPVWAKLVTEKVAHPVVVLPLQPKTVCGRNIAYYGGAVVEPGKVYDFVLIDGPPAFRRDTSHNRCGCLDFLPEVLAPDFVIIIDDASRPGELFLARELEKKLAAADITYRSGAVTAAKRQVVLCGGAYSPAGFF